MAKRIGPIQMMIRGYQIAKTEVNHNLAAQETVIREFIASLRMQLPTKEIDNCLTMATQDWVSNLINQYQDNQSPDVLKRLIELCNTLPPTRFKTDTLDMIESMCGRTIFPKEMGNPNEYETKVFHL